ncbi:MAG: protein kinase [Acidobacteriota bacterium]
MERRHPCLPDAWKASLRCRRGLHSPSRQLHGVLYPSHVQKTTKHYEIGEKLGEGGMGVVYKALDTKLARPVALKFLSAALGSEDSVRERFMQEARAASSLDHPNICTIFEIDESEDGEMFIAMAFYDGETLEQIIRRGPLEVERAVNFTTQVARGLSAAHEELIIHRDVKPGNIMITAQETVKILDFGLAKLASRAGLTRPDSSIGTPGYMSPEQIRSEAVDHRTDIWALGVVLYEMVTGKLPFPGERAESIIHSILSTDPARISSVRPGLPAKLERVIARMLAKSPRARYEKMSELIAELQDLQADVDSGSRTVQRVAEKTRKSIAVLPFVDMSPQKDQEYFCDGIAEELLGALSQIGDLHVASRTSSFQFKGSSMDIRDIGEKLNVKSVLEGSVRKAGDRVRVQAQLINVADGYRLWYERYDRDMEDIFAIQDEIAQNIAGALQVTLVGKQQPQQEKASAKEVEAYEYYLQGRQFFHQHRRKGYEIARQMFSKAIDVYPSYARAYAGLADCSSFLRLYFGHGDEAIAEAEEASRKAVELEPDLAEARVARGMALSLTKNYEEAERELKRAIELNPSLFDAHYVYGRVMLPQGNLREAAAHYEKACAITPEAFFAWLLLAGIYRGLGEDSKAKNAMIEGIEASKKHLNLHPEDTRAWTLGSAALSYLGEPEKANEWVERALAIDPDEPIILYNAACTYASLAKNEQALDCLDRAIDLGFLAGAKDWIDNDSDLDPIRGEPRFKEIVARLQ